MSQKNIASLLVTQSFLHFYEIHETELELWTETVDKDKGVELSVQFEYFSCVGLVWRVAYLIPVL